MKKKTGVKNINFIFMVAAVAMLFGMTTGCNDKVEKKEVKRPVVSGVTVLTITPSRVEEGYEVAGTVRSDRTSLVASRVMGVVTSLLVREGDAVQAGQLLLTIDDREAAQKVRSASMALEAARQNKALAEITWQRYRNLYAEKALSRQEMDQIETQKKVAEAEYERVKAMAEEAKTYHSFSKVNAPVSGIITEKRIDVGSMATPGMPLLIMEGGGGFHIEAAVDESLGDKIKTGMAVDISVDKMKRPVHGMVREIFPVVDSQSRTFIIKVGFKDNQTKSGRFVRIKVLLGTREALLVPGKAVVKKGQLTGVYAVDEQGMITYRLVRTGMSYSGGTEILSGLNPQDRVIIDGVERVVDGGIIERLNSGGKAR
jgi:RND family efflux transporter MFP subunit